MKYEKEKIKEIIKAGYDLELISFELDIPIEELNVLARELKENKKVKTYSAQEIIDRKNKECHAKMEKMREKYNQLYSKRKVANQKAIGRVATKEQLASIQSAITTIQWIMSKIDNQDRKEKMKSAQWIIRELDKIKDYPLTIEQAEQIYYLIHTKESKRLGTAPGDRIDEVFYRGEKLLVKRLAQAIDMAQSQTEDIEELRNLEKKLKAEMLQKNQVYVGAVQTRIRNKIYTIQQKAAIDRIRNGVPETVEGIVKKLASGKLEIQEAEKMVEQEVQKRIKDAPQNNFALTPEEQKRQVFMQIKKILIENAQQYPIQDEKVVIQQIQALCGDTTEQATNTVIRSFIVRKNFKRAKEMYQSLYHTESSPNAIALKNEIRNAEISNMVLKGLKTDVTMEEERRCVELIQKMEEKKIKLSTISLGKSQDGQKNITLGDIWGEERERKR